MTQKKDLFVFLDTNVHLHFLPFDGIEWQKILAASKVTLIFTHTILKELEKKKIEKISKLIGKRAEKAIKRIAEIMDRESKEIRKNVFVDFFVDSIMRAHFDKYYLNESFGDDRLLAEILFFQEKCSPAEILLITSDLGLKARAKHLNINVFQLPEKFQLPPEIDEDKKKIQELEKEIIELNRKKPELRLSFKDEVVQAKYFLAAPESFNNFANWMTLGTLRAKYPKLEIPETALQLSNSELKEKIKVKDKNTTAELVNVLLAYGELLLQIPASDYERYNAEIEQFYNNHSRYLEELQNAKNARNLILECDIKLSNNGTAPAEDIDIILELPDGIRFIYPEEFPKEPIEPNYPEPPEPIAAMIAKPVVNKARKFFAREQTNSTPLLVSNSEIAHSHPDRFFFSDNRQQAILKFSELKHYYSTILPGFHMVFNSFKEAKSFEINYKILPSNLPHPITGKLKVVIEKQQFTVPLLSFDETE